LSTRANALGSPVSAMPHNRRTQGLGWPRVRSRRHIARWATSMVPAPQAAMDLPPVRQPRLHRRGAL